jgi:hypothetical protein
MPGIGIKKSSRWAGRRHFLQLALSSARQQVSRFGEGPGDVPQMGWMFADFGWAVWPIAPAWLKIDIKTA